MLSDKDLTFAVIGKDLAVFAHDMDIPVAGAGLGGEGECRGYPIVKFQDHTHVVADIVVTPVYAAAVRPCFQGFFQSFLRLFQTDHIRGPCSESGKVAFFCLKTAIVRGGAGAAPVRGAGGGICFFKI